MTPQILEEAFHRVDFDQELVFKFFITFSLFEKALKENRFQKVKGKDNNIEPNWDAFAEEIDGHFTTIMNSPNCDDLMVAVDYLLRYPPKKQVFRNNQVRFIQTKRPQNMVDTVWISILIRRVRNNLFHGGKFIYERPRDTLLLQFSQIILEEWANCQPDIRQFLQDIQ